MQKFTLIILSILLFGACSNSAKQNDGLLLFAAAGSRIICNEILNLDEENPDFKITTSYASSGILARQIASGADADVFISANKKWVDYLINEGLLSESDVSCFAKNTLAVIASSGKEAISDLPALKTILENTDYTIGIGDPKFVPVGRYASELLENLAVSTEKKEHFIYAKDVTSVLRYVELGECNYGIVYTSEAMASTKVDIAFQVPDSLHSTIAFYVCKLNNNKAHAETVYSAMLDTTNTAVLLKHGFKLP